MSECHTKQSGAGVHCVNSDVSRIILLYVFDCNCFILEGHEKQPYYTLQISVFTKHKIRIQISRSLVVSAQNKDFVMIKRESTLFVTSAHSYLEFK